MHKFKNLNIDHGSIHTSILFNALYSSIILGVMFLFNDFIDQHIIKKTYYKKPTKLFLHMIIKNSIDKKMQKSLL